MDSARPPLVQRSAPDDGRGWEALGRLLVAILAVLWVCGGAACVRTAECDESTGCESGEVCFRYVCRSRCADSSDCDSGERCVPCRDPESGDNRCFGEQAAVCVPADGTSN